MNEFILILLEEKVRRESTFKNEAYVFIDFGNVIQNLGRIRHRQKTRNIIFVIIEVIGQIDERRCNSVITQSARVNKHFLLFSIQILDDVQWDRGTGSLSQIGLGRGS